VNEASKLSALTHAYPFVLSLSKHSRDQEPFDPSDFLTAGRAHGPRQLRRATTERLMIAAPLPRRPFVLSLSKHSSRHRSIEAAIPQGRALTANEARGVVEIASKGARQLSVRQGG
jgi:hypothetical protein